MPKLRCAALPCITGLRPSSLTKAERLHFGARSADYLDARYHRSLLFATVTPQYSSFYIVVRVLYRNSILQLWESQSQVYLSAKDCTGAYLQLLNRHLYHSCIECSSYSTTTQAITASLLSAEPSDLSAGTSRSKHAHQAKHITQFAHQAPCMVVRSLHQTLSRVHCCM